MVLPTRFQLVCLMAMNFKFIVYGNSTTVADECLINLTGIGWFIVLLISSSAKTTKLLSVSWTKRLLLDYCTSDNEAVFCNFRFGIREGTRNPDPQLKRLLLYQLSYTDIYKLLLYQPWGLSNVTLCTRQTFYQGFYIFYPLCCIYYWLTEILFSF